VGVTCENLVLGRGSFRLSANWSLPSGASLALIGPSGAGKSLFLGGLAGFETVHEGRVLIDGTDATGLAPSDRQLTLMFQDHNLFPHLTAFQNVALGVNPSLKLSDAESARVERALAEVELSGFSDRLPSQLSGGQQSRVALARALIRERALLLLDEPFSALGPGLRREMLALVEALRTGHQATLIFVTHSPQNAQKADFVSVVSDGVVGEPVEAEALFADPPEVLRDYL